MTAGKMGIGKAVAANTSAGVAQSPGDLSLWGSTLQQGAVCSSMQQLLCSSKLLCCHYEGHMC